MIEKFVNEWAFLSNFFQSTFMFDGLLWKTVEHAYQAQKTLDSKQRLLIQIAHGPYEAKRLGQCVSMRENWNIIKLDIMQSLLKEKFNNPFLKHQLLSTGDCELVNNNEYNDTFWGMYRGDGQNLLGKLLMQVREEYKKKDNKCYTT